MRGTTAFRCCGSPGARRSKPRFPSREIGSRWLTPERLSIFLSSRAAKAIRSITSCTYFGKVQLVAVALVQASCAVIAMPSSTVAGIVRANLRSNAVFQRRDDFAARGVILRIGAEHQRHIERQPDGISLNLHVAFLHDVEQSHLNFAREVGQFVDGEDAAVGARQQAIVHRQFAAKFVAAARRFDGIDVADQVGNRHIGCRQLFHVAFFRREIRNRRLRRPAARSSSRQRPADRRVRIVVNFASGDIWHLRIEQRGQRAQDAAFRLPAQSQQNEIVPRKNGVDDLRHHRVVISHNAGKHRRRPGASFATRLSRSSSFTLRVRRRSSENSL